MGDLIEGYFQCGCQVQGGRYAVCCPFHVLQGLSAGRSADKWTKEMAGKPNEVAKA